MRRYQAEPFLSFLPGLRDLISNLNATVVFWYKGLGIYQYPIETFLQPPLIPTDEFARFWDWNPQEFYQAPFWQNKRPLMIIWPQVPRPYPPGLFISLTPLSLLMSVMGGLNTLVYTLTTWLYCFWAHLAFFAAWSLIKNYSSRLVRGLCGVLIYHELIGWSLSSQYDPYALLFVFLALEAIHKNSYKHILFYFSLALFIHFRALFWLPLLGFPFLTSDRGMLEKINQSFKENRKSYLIALTLVLISVLCFILMYAGVAQAIESNPFRRMLLSLKWDVRAWIFIGTFFSLLIWGFIKKDKTMAISSIWILIVLLSMGFLQIWYTLFFLPLMVVGLKPRAGFQFFARRGLMYLLLSYFFLNYWPTGFIQIIASWTLGNGM